MNVPDGADDAEKGKIYSGGNVVTYKILIVKCAQIWRGSADVGSKKEI